jgi:hypothetical protein
MTRPPPHPIGTVNLYYLRVAAEFINLPVIDLSHLQDTSSCALRTIQTIAISLATVQIFVLL